MAIRRTCYILSPLVVAIAVINFLIFSSGAAAAFKNIKVGDQVPPMELADLEGARHSLADAKDAKAVLLFFWATWSERSLKEIDFLLRLQKDYGDKGLTILSINVEKQEMKPEDLEKVRAAAKEKSLSFPVLLDEGLKIFNSYGVMATPTTAIIDPAGVMVFDLSSFSTAGAGEVEDAVRKALGLAVAEDAKVVKAPRYQPNQTAMLHLGMGKRLLDKGLPDKAIPELSKAMAADSLYADPRLYLGYAKIKEGKTAEAEPFLQKASELDTSTPGSILLLAYVRAEQGRVKEALSLLQDPEGKALFDGLDLAAPSSLAAEGKETEAKDSLLSPLKEFLSRAGFPVGVSAKKSSLQDKLKMRFESETLKKEQSQEQPQEQPKP